MCQRAFAEVSCSGNDAFCLFSALTNSHRYSSSVDFFGNQEVRRKIDKRIGTHCVKLKRNKGSIPRPSRNVIMVRWQERMPRIQTRVGGYYFDKMRKKDWQMEKTVRPLCWFLCIQQSGPCMFSCYHWSLRFFWNRPNRVQWKVCRRIGCPFEK